MASLGVRSRRGQRDGGIKGGRAQQAEGQQVEVRGQGTGSGRWKGRGWDPRVRGSGVKRGEQEGRNRAMQSCNGP